MGFSWAEVVSQLYSQARLILAWVIISALHALSAVHTLKGLAKLNFEVGVQFHPVRKSPFLWFCLALVGAAGFVLLGPAEPTLGTNVRVVYLHGAWVWAALGSFLAAALVGFLGLLLRSENIQRWSRAIGRTGLFFWITYLPVSMWAMQTNWNGLYLAEPRWRLALIFALGGILLQVGVTLVEDPAWASAANVVYFIALLFALARTENVMHPPAPILSSDAWRIQIFFGGLLILVLSAAGLFARWLFQFEHQSA